MSKIPVAATIGEAYRFAFGGFFGNLGVVWLPVLLFMAAAWYLVLPGFTAWSQTVSQISDASDPQAANAMLMGMMEAYRAMLLFWIAALLLRAQMMLGVTERALGTHKGPGFVFLSLGKPFWRVAGAFFAVFIILITAEMVLVLGLVLLGVVIGFVAAAFVGGGKEMTGLVIGSGVAIGGVALFCALFYVAVRLTFFLTTAIVAEGRFDLFRPWRLAGGNFWRIFAIGVAVFVPLGIAISAIYVPIELAALGPFMHLPAAQAHDPQAGAKMMQHLASGIREMVQKRWYILVPLGLVGSTLIYGIAAGASVAAYRALVPEERAEAAE